MIWPLFWTTWRERLLRPLPAVLLALVLITHALIALASPDHVLLDPAWAVTLIIAAGSVGRDVSTGFLALVFTRPLTRSSYIFTKWLAVSLASVVLSWLGLVVQQALFAGEGSMSGFFAELFGSATTALGLSSVLLVLSCLVPGFGDVGLWVAGGLATILVNKVFGMRAGEEISGLLTPTLPWADTFGSNHSWFALCSYLSTVVLCLALAVVLANRKELSYASG